MLLDLINKNFKFLRKKHGSTQQEFADLLQIKRASVGAYEEGRAKPNLDVLKFLASEFTISLDLLINKDLGKMTDSELQQVQQVDATGKQLRVLSITIDENEKENIELVPVKASAGYLNGHSDPGFIAELPRFNLPMLPTGTYRAFEIKGDSMLPLQPGSVVIGEYEENWYDIKNGHTYIVLSKNDGVVYKRLFNGLKDSGAITCQSDNPSYPPFDIKAEDIMEIWKAKLFISKAEPISVQGNDSQDMMAMLRQMQAELKDIKRSN